MYIRSRKYIVFLVDLEYYLIAARQATAVIMRAAIQSPMAVGKQMVSFSQGLSVLTYWFSHTLFESFTLSLLLTPSNSHLHSSLTHTI